MTNPSHPLVNPPLTLELANHALACLKYVKSKAMLGSILSGQGETQDVEDNAKVIQDALLVLQALAQTA